MSEIRRGMIVRNQKGDNMRVSEIIGGSYAYVHNLITGVYETIPLESLKEDEDA